MGTRATPAVISVGLCVGYWVVGRAVGLGIGCLSSSGTLVGVAVGKTSMLKAEGDAVGKDPSTFPLLDDGTTASRENVPVAINPPKSPALNNNMNAVVIKRILVVVHLEVSTDDASE